MTDNGKKFLEKASQDAELKAELQAAQGAALNGLLKEKGLEDEASQATAEAIIKVAAAHGVALTAEDLKAGELKALSEEELKAVAGGGLCVCPIAGGGTGEHLTCGCGVIGAGRGFWGENICVCLGGGYGKN